MAKSNRKLVYNIIAQKALVRAFWVIIAISAVTITSGSHANEATNSPLSVPEILSKGHKALASDPSLAREIHTTLSADYENQPQDIKWNIDFLGAKIRYQDGDSKGNTHKFQQLLDKPLPNTLAIEVSTYLAGIYSIKNQFEQAFETLNEAVSRIDETTSMDVKMEALARAAALNELAGGYSEAYEYGVRLFEIAKQANSKKFICRSGYYIAKGWFGLKKYEQAEKQFLKTVEDCKKTEEVNAVRFVEQDMAYNWLEMRKTEQALALLLELRNQISPSNYWAVGVAKNKFLLAKAFWQKEEWLSAIASGSDAIRYAKEIDYPLAVREASYILGLSYGHLKQFDKAYNSLLIHLEASKLVTDETQARALAYQRAKYDAQDKARQIRQLENENRVLALEQALQNSERRVFIIFATLGAILLFTIVLHFRRQRTQFRLLAELDGLTGISNRHHIMAAGQKLISECQKRQRDFGVILFDLDNFKRVNDEFGHAAGDWVLQKAAVECKTRLRKGDLFGRYGGEEFIVILPDVTLETLKQKAEMMRSALEKIDTSETGSRFSISASFGVTHVCKADKPSTLSILVNEADSALYRAKTKGRNRVKVY